MSDANKRTRRNMAETQSTEALQREILELSNQLLRSAGESESTAAVLGKIIELCHQTVAGDEAFILLHDKAAGELVGIIQSGASYRPEGHFRLHMEEASLGVWAFKQGQSTAVEDAAQDTRVSPRMREHFGTASLLAAPLRLNQAVTGVLMITSRKPRAYSARDLALLEALAREAAFAMRAQQSREARLRAEAALGESEFRFQALLEAAPEPILVNVDGRYVYANPAALELYGADSPDEILGKDTLFIVHPDSWDLVRERVAKHLRGEPVPNRVEQRWIRADGSTVEVEVTAVPFLFDGKPAVHVMARDITARKQAEAVLRESDERNRTLLEVSPEVSMLKIKGSEIIQTLAELKMHALGHDALPYVREALDIKWGGNPLLNTHYGSYAPPLSGQYFNQRKTTIYAGSTEVQKNIISQMILGL